MDGHSLPDPIRSEMGTIARTAAQDQLREMQAVNRRINKLMGQVQREIEMGWIIVASDSFQKPYRADFIEHHSKNLNALRERVLSEASSEGWNLEHVHFHLGNFKAIVPKLLRRLDDRELGLAFVDTSGDVPDFDALQELAAMRPRMEILMYVSSTNIKRAHHRTNKLLSDYMADMGKTHWLIRKPTLGDKHGFTFLLGSNTDIFRDYRSIDFLRLDSDEAQTFFPTLDLTAEQRHRRIQPGLPGILDVK